ncbi:MAG: polysaccharide biosynthesis C-terminal domain-containing protein, partial [Bacteroidota bacterium]
LWVAMPYAALKYSKPLPYFYLVVALIKIGLLYWFVQRWGVWGAIVSTLVSYSIEIIVLFLGVRKRFNFQMNTLKLLLAPVVVGVVVLVCEPLLGARYPWVVHGFYLLVSVTTLAWAYRNELKVIGFSPFKLVK